MLQKRKIFNLVIGIFFITVLAVPMVRAELSVGEAAPEFTLMDTNGNEQGLLNFRGKYVVMEWFNPDCPFVRKHYDTYNMQKLQQKYTNKGVIWLSINSSAEGKQGYYPAEEYNRLFRQGTAKPSAILLDHDGKVGKMYEAKTTPHIFIIDPDGILIYQGAIDSVPSANHSDVKNAENYVQLSLDAAMAGQPINISATKSYGCSVKY